MSREAMTPESSPQMTRIDRRNGKKVTPTRWRVNHRIPDKSCYEELIKVVAQACPFIADEIFQSIKKYYYVVLERGVFTDYTILSTLEIENETGEGIKGKDHRLKAAQYYKEIDSAIGQIALYMEIHPECESIASLKIYHNFLITLNSKLLDELKLIPDDSKQRIKQSFLKLDIDKLQNIKVTPRKRKAVDTINRTPEKDSTGASPEKDFHSRLEAFHQTEEFFSDKKPEIQEAQKRRRIERGKHIAKQKKAAGLKRQKEKNRRAPKANGSAASSAAASIQQQTRQLAEKHDIELLTASGTAPQDPNMFSFLAPPQINSDEKPTGLEGKQVADDASFNC